MAAKKEIVVPAKGFYVIVPPEYRVLGCIPPEHFISYLMRYWGHRYYAGLLTAARYHGASHQAAQVFQVMTDVRCPSIHCGKVRIQFITNRHLLNTPVQTISTPRSMLNVSTPESTAMDLLNYPQQSGGLNHITTVLTELKETMQPKNLQSLAEAQPRLAWKQRLGYLLEIVEAPELADVLKKHLARQKRIDYISLAPELKNTNKVSRNQEWKIIENTEIESDL